MSKGVEDHDDTAHSRGLYAGSDGAAGAVDDFVRRRDYGTEDVDGLVFSFLDRRPSQGIVELAKTEIMPQRV